MPPLMRHALTLVEPTSSPKPNASAIAQVPPVGDGSLDNIVTVIKGNSVLQTNACTGRNQPAYPATPWPDWVRPDPAMRSGPGPH